MNYDKDVRVQGLNILDASYIKTPFNEERPGDMVKGGAKSPYGLMIACDGYSMDRGLEEFWNMVVDQNVTIITSLNEKFGKGRGKSWMDVYQYFPDEKECRIPVGNNIRVALKKKETF